MLKKPKPLVLLILDGFGYTENTHYNAIASANTPCWNRLQQVYPVTQLNCSGEVVGLPDEQMGNSEVGHIHIGAGRFVYQDFSRVNRAIHDESFFSNPILCEAVDAALNNNKALHILGLLSPGGVHSHEQQILALVDMAARRGLKKIYMHAFLDGRDVPPQSAAASLKLLEDKFAAVGVGRIVSIVGRFYAMDRDSRWERVESAYKLIAQGKAEYVVNSPLEGLEDAYQRGETDEFVSPTLIQDANAEVTSLDADDSVVFMNFRADRAREISQALTATDFDSFVRGRGPHSGMFTTLTEYHQDFNYPVAFAPIEVNNSLGEVLANTGMKQLRLSETEKYAHVTFFLNGGRDKPFKGEDRILVPSPKVKTYDMQPEMSASEVTDHLLEAIIGQQYDVIICNYANCDMVGHTGKWEPALVAVETIDAALQKIVDALESVGGQALITADHGNIEQMRDEQTGQPHTAHTTNLVPLLYVGGTRKLQEGGSLVNLAPTMLEILGVQQPAEMTSKSLLEKL